MSNLKLPEAVQMNSSSDDLIESLFDAFAIPIDFPFAAVREAKASWAIVGTQFIDVLEDAVADPWDTIESDLMWHDFAYRLAADMRDVRAFAPLIAMLYFPEDTVEALLGDALTSDIGRALAATFDTRDPAASEAALRAVAENRRLYIWSRLAAVDAVCIRAHAGDADRASVKVWLHALCVAEFQALQAGEEDEDSLALLVNCLLDFSAVEYLPDIEHWWTTLNIGHPNDSIEDIRREIVKPYDPTFPDYKFNRYCHELTEEFATWATFTEQRYRNERAAVDADAFDADEVPLQMPYVREFAKVGRNDPCPCGSGLKFKKCCGKDG